MIRGSCYLTEAAAVHHRHEATRSVQPRDEHLLPGDHSLRFNDTGIQTGSHKHTAPNISRHVIGGVRTCSNASCSSWVQIPPWPGAHSAEGSWAGWWRKRSQTSPAAPEAARSPANREEEEEVEEEYTVFFIIVLHSMSKKYLYFPAEDFMLSDHQEQFYLKIWWVFSSDVNKKVFFVSSII